MIDTSPYPQRGCAATPVPGGTAKRIINTLAGAGTTLLALWLVVADFSFPGTMLFQDPTSLLVLTLYLCLLFFAMLVLAPLPKRLVIGANLLALARAALGWPLSLAIDPTLACRVLSLALLMLGIFHLSIGAWRAGVHHRPWFDLRHTLTGLVLSLVLSALSIPWIVLGYLEAGKELMGDYVQIRWDGVSLVERVFERDGRKVHLVGMMHIGDSSYYDALNQRMHTPPATGRRLVLTEGVRDATGVLPNEFKSGELYTKLAASLGLRAQGAHHPPGSGLPTFDMNPGSGRIVFRNADIDISSLGQRERDTLLSIFSMLNAATLEDMLLAEPEGLTGYDLELLYRDGLLRQRNDALMAQFSASAADFTEVYIPWGAAHLPDIQSRLLELGYHQSSEAVRPIVRFWD